MSLRITKISRLLLTLAKKNKHKPLFIGSGSNILAKDPDIKKIVVHLNSGNFAKVKFEGNYCEAGSGVALWRIDQATFIAGT